MTVTAPTRRRRQPERELARAGVLATLVVTLPAATVAWMLAGTSGLRGALLAGGLVLAMYALSGVVGACAARWWPGSLPGVSFAGFALRLVVYTVVLAAAGRGPSIDRASLLAVTALLLAVTLLYEGRYASTKPGFYWVDADATERTHP
ncbi:MAG: hypothetical protein ACR2MA_02680 [Egibacteraceae bacterium]